MSNEKAISTEDLTSKGFKWQDYNGRDQHDAHELNRLLIDAMEKSLKGTKGETLCQNLYRGKLCYQTTCSACKTVSEREESFYDLIIQILNCGDLVKSLHEYCKREVLADDSAYDCSVCGRKQTAHRGISLKQLPEVLTFSCVRFRMDRTTNWQREKLFSKHEFPLLLNMDDFVEGGNVYEVADEDVYSLNDSMLWIRDVVATVDKIVAEILPRYSAHTDNNSSTGDQVSLDSLNPEDSNYVAEKMEAMMARICRGKSSTYQLHAVILHRGSAFSGHYFAYIRDNLGEGTWNVEQVASKTCKMDCFIYEDALYIRKDSPLSSIMDIFQLHGTSMNHNSLEVQVLGSQFIALGREMWNKSFRGQYGTLNSYLKHHEELVSSKQNEIVLKRHLYKSIEVLPTPRFESMYSKKESTGTGASAFTNNGGAVSDTTHDELLARELQSKLNIEDNEKVESTKDESSNNWQEVPRRNKKFNSPTRTNNKKKINHSPVNKKSQQDPVAAPEKKSQLFHDIASKYIGCYYEFNDSVVKPMTVSDISNAFEGKDSAYMLIYRKVKRRDVSTESPLLWKTIVEQRNAELAKLKQVYDNSNHSVQLILYCATDMMYEPLISPLLTVPPDKIPDTITIDTRSSLEELYKQIENIAVAKNAMFPVVVSEIVPIDSVGFHILDTAPATGTVETITGAANSKTLLIWNGKSVQGHDVVAVGPVAAPLKFNISILSFKNVTGTDLNPVVNSDLLFQQYKLPPVAVSLVFDIYVLKTASVEEFVSTIRQRVMLETKCYDKDIVIHEITDDVTDQQRFNNAQSKSNIKKAGATTIVKGVNNVSSKLHQLVTSLSSHELFVEDIEARGVFSRSLADSEITKRNNSLTIHIDIDVKPALESIGATTVSVPVYSEATIKQLKQYIFQATSLSEEEVNSSYRFRMGFNKGEEIVVDEDKTVSALGLKHNSSITLETGAKPTSTGEIFIRVIAVTGNGTSTMTCAEKGVRGHEIEMQVSTKDTMKSVRDRAAVLLYPEKYTEGWTAASSSINLTKRLRKTNQFLEAGELVVENIDGFKKTELATVAKCSLSNGAVLLLEDGAPPIKGQVEFKLLLWSPSSAIPEEPHQLPITTLDELQATMTKINSYKRSHFISIGELQAHQDWTISDLQQRIYDLLLSQSLPLKPVDAGHVLLREMRADTLLPGKSYCATSDGVKKPLKFHHLVIDQELVVEIAPPEHDRTQPNHSFRIWVQRVISPSVLTTNDLAAFNANKNVADLVPIHEKHLSAFSPWPPTQILINGGPRPALVHLRRPVATALDVDFDSLVVFKYVTKTSTWIEFVNNRNSKKIDYISVSPYMLKEGDLVCAMACNDLSSTTRLTINRLEDYGNQHLKKIAEINKSSSKIKKVVKVVTREVLLTIGGDDSDEDNS